MAFLDDLIKASSFLNQQVGQLQMSRTIDQANQMVQQVKASEADERQQRAQLQQISNALTMDLARFGAPADIVKMLGQTIAPQRFFQTPEQALINPDMASPDQVDAARGIYEQEVDLKREQIGLKRDAAAAELGRKKEDRLFRAIEGGQKRIDQLGKKSREAFEAASTMREMLLSNNPIADAAVPTFAARATGEVGNLTEAERKPFGSSQAIHRRLAALSKKATTGKLTDADRQDLLKLASVFETAAQRNLRQVYEGVGKQLASNLGVDKEEVFSRLIPDYAPSSRQGSSNLIPVRMRDRLGNIVELYRDPQTGELFRRR